MTHPLREPKREGRKPRIKQGEPFDPEDLSRRLTAHLAEEKAKVERRRAAREAKVADGAHFYHHVPLSAASAFERTTTQVDVMKSLPKAARPAVKAHLNALRIEVTQLRRASKSGLRNKVLGVSLEQSKPATPEPA